MLIAEQRRALKMMGTSQRMKTYLRKRYLRAWNHTIVDKDSFFKVVYNMHNSGLYSENTIPGDVAWSICNHLARIRFPKSWRPDYYVKMRLRDYVRQQIGFKRHQVVGQEYRKWLRERSLRDVIRK